MSDTELEEKEATPGSHDDLGVPKERAEAETEELNKLFDDDSIKEPDGGLYKGGQAPKKSGGKLKKRLAIGGGIAGAGIITGVIGFFALLPLKMVHIIENLQTHFFSSSESAIGNYTDGIFSNYVKRHLIPGLRGTCTQAKVEAQCIAPGSTSPLDKLYRGWRDSNFEQKLATDYGLVFERNGDQIFMRLPDADTNFTLFNQTGKGFDLTGFDSSPDNDLFDYIKKNNPKTKMSRQEIRQKVRDAFQGETKIKRVLYRYKFGKFMERKYGVKRCVVACKTKDGFADWKENKKLAFKSTLIDRIIKPHSEISGIILTCLVSGGCGDPSTSVDKDGNGNSAVEVEIKGKVDALFKRLGVETVSDTLKAASDIADQGFSKWFAAQLLTKIGVQNATDAASNTIDGIGWVSKVVSLLKFAKNAGPTIKRLAYVSSSVAMVQMYMTYRTHVDEIKSGKVSSETVGSFQQAMDGIHLNDQGRAYAPAGGAENAENSPLYKDILGSDNIGSAQLTLGSFFNQTASAQSTDQHSPNYTCDNKQPIPKGELICPEEHLNQDNPFQGLSDFLNNGILGGATDGLLTVWDDTIGAVTNKIGDIANYGLEAALSTPVVGGWLKDGIKAIISPFMSKFQDVMGGLIEFLVPSPISTDMSGARTFDMVAGGADVAGNDYSHYSLGGKELTPAQQAAIQNDQAQSDQIAFSQESFTQRMFDKNNSKSLVSQVAMAVPSNIGDSVRSFFGDLLTNPISKLVSSFGSLFNIGRVHAQTAKPDPFDVTQFGYPVDDPALSQEPVDYTDQQCADMNTAWLANEKMAENGQFTNTSTNPCLLQKAAVEGLGALSDSSLVDPADQ